jgi:protein-L-isoaspartate O-methyltransferase
VTPAHNDFADRILTEAYWGDGTLTDPAWREAFDAVPRSVFAPDTWFEWDGFRWIAQHRADDEDAWQQAVYDIDRPFITQIGADGVWPTCSLSAPVLVAAMLGALELDDGMRVLESGTGTGWTAGLMARRVGPEGTVVTVEYDPGLAATAAANLNSLHDPGLAYAIAVGDGEAGKPGLGPFDRVSATHSVSRIPRAWIEQTKPGGLVCAPLKVGTPDLDVYVALTVGKDGSADGRVRFPVDFMASRTAVQSAKVKQADDEGRTSATNLDLPAIIAANQTWPLRLAIPGLTVTGPVVEDGDDCVWLGTSDGSWAVAYVPQGAPWDGAVVEQHGPADVWTTAEAAWARWRASSSPGLDEYGLTVEADGTHKLWMREPGNVVTTLP